MKNALTLGINPYLSNADYHADKEYLSSSKLKTLLDNPAKFKKELDNPPPPMTGTHLEVGSYTHSLLLEPNLVSSEYAVFPGFRRAGTEFEKFKLANSDKKIISLSIENTGKLLANSIKANPFALDLLADDGESEVSIATELVGVKVKCRFDRIRNGPKRFVDIKTTGEPSGKEYFKQTIKDFDYDLSAALYTDIGNQQYQIDAEFYWIVLSKADFQCKVYKASPDTMNNGRTKVYKALEIYKKCTASNIWLDETVENMSKLSEAIEEI